MTSLLKVVAPVFVIVNLSTIVLAAAPLDPALAVLNTIDPLPPVPVPLPAKITVFAPVMFVPAALPLLNVASPPAPLVVASPPLNVARPPAPLVTPPAPPATNSVLPALVAPVAPVVTVKLLLTCVLIVCAVLATPTVCVVLLINNACTGVAPADIVLNTRLNASLAAVTLVATDSI